MLLLMLFIDMLTLDVLVFQVLLLLLLLLLLLKAAPRWNATSGIQQHSSSGTRTISSQQWQL